MSDDEIAAYDPTTPFKVVPVKKSKPNSRTGGPVAGPSSKPASGATGTKRKNTNKSPEPSDSDDLYGTEALAEDDEEVIVVPPEKKARKGRADTAANGKATSKGKGKAKAEPPPKTSRKAAEPIEVDDVEVLDETEVETVTRPPARAAAKSKKPATTTARNTKNSDKELSHLRQKLADAEARRDALSAQLEELFQVRNTAAEESLDHQSLHYEARLNTQEKLIQELTSQLARVEPLARSGKTSLLHFLTRDAADQEQRGLENEVNRWKDIAKAKDAIIAEKDKRITELERAERDARYELNAEIERSKTLAAKTVRAQPPGSATRGRVRGGGIFGADDPKNAAVIQFYEDLTNLLVPNLKFEPGKYLGLEEKCFTCIYTYMDLDKIQNEEGDRGQEKSLTFTLRFYHDLIIPEAQRTPADEHVTSPDQLVRSIKYTPLQLDKESEDFIEKLRFLGEAFTFGSDQLALFLKTMYDTLGGAVQEDEEEGMEEYE